MQRHSYSLLTVTAHIDTAATAVSFPRRVFDIEDSPFSRRFTLTASSMSAPSAALVLTPEQFLHQWQGHRGLTRRVIEAFPDDKLFNYSIGGMRPFSTLAMEFLGMAVPTLHGVITGEWKSFATPEVNTKADILRLWDEATTQINAMWPTIPPRPVSGSRHRVRAVEDDHLRASALRRRQRDSSSRSRLRLPSIVGHRAAAILRSSLIRSRGTLLSISQYRSR